MTPEELEKLRYELSNIPTGEAVEQTPIAARVEIEPDD